MIDNFLPTGGFTSEPGAPACIGVCPRGQYSNTTTKGLCAVCPPGTFQNETGKDHCRPYSRCPKEYYYKTTETNQVQDRNMGVILNSCTDGCARCSCNVKSYVSSPLCQGNGNLENFISGAEGSCTTCNTCAGKYYNRTCNGLGTTDTQACLDCTICADGHIIHTQTPCLESQDTVCNRCLTCDPGTKTSCVGDESGKQNQCKPCDSCSPGSYITNGCPIFNPHATNCTTCGIGVTCPQGQYLPTCDGKGIVDTTCTNCTKCSMEYFETGNCTGNSTTQVCQVCKTCERGMYISSSCTAQNLQPECTECEGCRKGQYIQEKCNGTGTSSMPTCRNCDKCEAGEYISGCDGTGSNGTSRTCVACNRCPTGTQSTTCSEGTGTTGEVQCSNCSNTCAAGERWDSQDGAAPCSCVKCPGCALGKKLIGCTQGGVSTCVACKSCDAGSFIKQQCTGGVVDNTNCSKCEKCESTQMMTRYNHRINKSHHGSNLM